MFKTFFVRHFATAIKKTKVKPNAVTAKPSAIKNLNFENKALFGAVIKDDTKPSIPVDQSESSSEMFWMLQTKTAPHVRPSSSSSKANQSSVTYGSPIPFEDVELRSMLTFPLTPSSSGKLERTWKRHEQFESDQYRCPSVGKILSATMSEGARQALLNWKASKIAQLGEDGFAELQRATLERGSNFHSCLESWLNEEDVDEDRLAKAKELWTSISGQLGRIERPARIIERKIYHPFLHYNGVVDCVSSIDNKLHIIEWKTSENQKPSLSATYDAPVQLCAYLGALRADPELTGLDIASGAVFVAYTGGNPAHVHLINQTKLKKYWSVWMQRLQEYWIRYRDGTLPEPI
uniref:Mitochondrial genome maintenance exonuclease 1 n=1 Tax=Culex pipiens TaxID=7175 RepID=A0A8D8KFB1_CULPI